MPQNEKCRLEALRSYEVLDTPPEASFDRITRLVCLSLNVPIALVSLIDEERQWFKSKQGLEACETSRGISFCTHAIEFTEPLIVADANKDARFASNPLVTGDPHIRFYIGVPLRTPEGYNIGTLCAIDRKPRDISESEVELLQDLARVVMDELELRKLATTDSLTGAMTRRAFMLEANTEVARTRRYQHNLACLMLDVDRFKAINDRFGHAAGDLALQTIAKVCRQRMRVVDRTGRIGGEEFVVMLPQTSHEQALLTAERLRKWLGAIVIEHTKGRIKVSVSIGVASLLDSEDDFVSMLERADEALFQAKAAGRNRVASAATGLVSQNRPIDQDCGKGEAWLAEQVE